MGYDEEQNKDMQLVEENCHEKIKETTQREDKFKRAVARYCNAKVILCQIPRDLVLRNTQILGTGKEKGKLAPKWKDPYIIKEEIRPGSYILVKEDETKIKKMSSIRTIEVSIFNK